MAALVGGIVLNGLETLRQEITTLQEILHKKNERLHEMESFLLRLQGRPSSMSYEPEALEASIVTVATVAAIPAVSSPNTETKLKDKEILKVFYKGKVIGVGTLHIDSKEKKGYYILDTNQKKYTTFSKWSFARKKEMNPSLEAKADDGKRAVNCYRNGKWIKLSDLS
jgi:hypothetical protein